MPHLVKDYQLNIKWDWFSLKGRKAAYVCNVMTHVSLGIALWSVPFYPLDMVTYFRFVGMGVVFFILGQFFWIISHKELLLRQSKRMKKKWGKNGTR